MPARPVVKKKGGNDGGGGDDNSGSIRGPRKDLEWSLRTLRKVDTGAQHFLQNFYDSDSDGDSSTEGSGLIDQSAYQIFKGKHVEHDANGHHSVWAALNAPLRTGIVDGRKVVFELLSDVEFLLKQHLQIPTFTINKVERYKRVTLIIKDNMK